MLILRCIRSVWVHGAGRALSKIKTLSRSEILIYCVLFAIFKLLSWFLFYKLVAYFFGNFPPSLPRFWNSASDEIVDFSYADNVTGYPVMIVPNVVHFIKFRSSVLEFTEMVNIKAVIQNHNPDEIIIHCDCYTLKGRYWYEIRDTPNLRVKFMLEPSHIFGKPLSSVYHVSDVARLKILIENGGIYLDTDMYVVRSLDHYRHFEFTIGWPEGANIGNQLLIAHKNSRFLKLWLDSYRHYKSFMWYYNAGQLPTEEILNRMPSLVHRVKRKLGVHNLVDFLYKSNSDKWEDYDAVHLLSRHRKYLDAESGVDSFDEDNIKGYNRTYGKMVRNVLFQTSELVA